MSFSLAIVLGDPRHPDRTKPGQRFNPEDIDARRRMLDALASVDGYALTVLDDHRRLVEALRGIRTDLIVNFCDTGFSNDPFLELHVAALFDVFGLPYTGAPPACMAVCFDKALVRVIAKELGIAVPVERYFPSSMAAIGQINAFPVLIKPNQADGSLGITKESVAHDRDAVDGYLRQLAQLLPDRAVLVQEYLSGQEYGIGLVGNPGADLHALPAMQVDYSRLPEGYAPILGYESKTIPGSPYWTDIGYRAASLDVVTRERLESWSRVLFERLGCRDYARFDWRTDRQGEVKLLEVNPNPAWAWDGKLAMMAGFAGWTYAQMLERIVTSSRKRLGV